MREGLGLLRSLLLYRRPGRQRGLRRFYRAFVAPGDLVFDVGAHLGDRSAAFAALGARVVALEPHPRIARWLERLTRGNERITVRAVALGRAPGEGTLRMSRRTPTVSTLSRAWSRRMPDANPGFHGVRWDGEVTVPVTTLDALIAEHGVPTFCKIDVEGYEAEVLEGLSQPVNALSFEFVQGSLDVAAACVRRLEALGQYEFNTAAGEGRRLRLGEWTTGAALLDWLEAGAGGAPSGDVYARIHPSVP